MKTGIVYTQDRYNVMKVVAVIDEHSSEFGRILKVKSAWRSKIGKSKRIVVFFLTLKNEAFEIELEIYDKAKPKPIDTIPSAIIKRYAEQE